MVDLLAFLRFKSFRNYSLTGPERQRAFDDGLVNAEWYQTPVDRKVLKELMKRSDGPALHDTAIWLGLLVLSGFGGIWFLMSIGLPQHVGLAQDVLDYRLNSRTFLLPAPVRFIYWNMNYHVEHHMFPTVPYHALPKLHEVIKHDCAPVVGFWATWRIILPTMLRQLRDQSYYIHNALPPGAGAARLGPRTIH